MSDRPIRLAYLVSHPIQYQAPFLRLVASQPNIDLKVFFMSDFSLREYEDKEFKSAVAWDVPLVGGYAHEVLPGEGNDKPIQTPRLPKNKDLKKILREGGFDVLWSHGYAHFTNIRAILAARQLGMKVLIRSENHLGSTVDTGWKRKLKEMLLRTMLPKLDGFLAIGSKNRDYYLHYGVPSSKIFVMPYTVDNGFFAKSSQECSPNRDKLRAELGFEPGRPIILYASKFTARKRAGDLLEAYRKLSDDGVQEPRPYLLYIGDGEQRGDVQRRAEALGWNSIRFLGFKNQSELPAYFDLCDVFVLASDREPWGLIVNEVMNAGRAVIVSDGVGSGPDLVKDGANGYVVPVGDIDALADRLRIVTSDPATAARMGACSSEIISHWSYVEALASLNEALCQVTAKEVR